MRGSLVSSRIVVGETTRAGRLSRAAHSRKLETGQCTAELTAALTARGSKVSSALLVELLYPRVITPLGDSELSEPRRADVALSEPNVLGGAARLEFCVGMAG